MRRTVLLTAGVLPFVSAFFGGVMAFSVVAPTILEAQEARLRAESVTIVGGGTDRLRLASKHDGQASDVSLLGPDGTTRLAVGAGGISAACPNAAGINIYAEDGKTVARLGTGSGPACNVPLATALVLFDQRGQNRIRLSVAEDGTPSALMYGADGEVIWSAP